MPTKQNKKVKKLEDDESIVHSLETYLLMFYDNAIDSSELVRVVNNLLQERNVCQ